MRNRGFPFKPEIGLTNNRPSKTWNRGPSLLFLLPFSLWSNRSIGESNDAALIVWLASDQQTRYHIYKDENLKR